MITNRQRNTTEIITWVIGFWHKRYDATIPRLWLPNNFEHVLGSMNSDIHTVMQSKEYSLLVHPFHYAKMLHDNHGWKPPEGLGSWLRLGMEIAAARSQKITNNRLSNWRGFSEDVSKHILEKIFQRKDLKVGNRLVDHPDYNHMVFVAKLALERDLIWKNDTKDLMDIYENFMALF